MSIQAIESLEMELKWILDFLNLGYFSTVNINGDKKIYNIDTLRQKKETLLATNKKLLNANVEKPIQNSDISIFITLP